MSVDADRTAEDVRRIALSVPGVTAVYGSGWIVGAVRRTVTAIVPASAPPAVVQADIAIDGSRSARLVADEVRRALVSGFAAEGAETPDVRVTVSAIGTN